MTNRDTYDEAETVRRSEAALKRMLATPHQPHKAHAPLGKKRKAAPKKGKESKRV
jgi:hypothetical protein